LSCRGAARDETERRTKRSVSSGGVFFENPPESSTGTKGRKRFVMFETALKSKKIAVRRKIRIRHKEIKLN
jgi:hypothetical protein